MSDALLSDAPATDTSPKRRQVIEAATDLFLANGYGAVSMDAIARAASVSKATLYAHFASKDVLFATIMRERSLAKQLDAPFFPDHAGDLRAALESIGRLVLRFMVEERTLAIYRIALTECARFPELGRAFYDNGPGKSKVWAEEWLAKQQAAGLVRACDLTVATQQFMALLRSSVFMRASLALLPAPQDDEIESTVRAAVDTWLRAFGTGAALEAGFDAPHDCA